MNIYKKIQQIRVDLQSKNIKKSGKNSYSKYSYYELADFIPELNILMDECGVISKFDLGQEATLELINIDKPEERIIFSIPVATVELKGGQAIQNLGSAITYLRRYLFLVAFEIVESDVVDQQDKITSEPKKVEYQKKESVKLATDKQVDELMQLADYTHNIDLIDKLKTKYKVDKMHQLSEEVIVKAIDWLNSELYKQQASSSELDQSGEV